MFGISKETLYRLIRKGVIPSVNAGQRQTRVSKETLMEMYPLRRACLRSSPSPFPSCIVWNQRIATRYNKRVRNTILDRTNRIFYKKVIMDEKRKRNYQELDSLIHSDSFFKKYWGLNN